MNWVLDADIRSFFDTIDHGWMQKFIEHRIGDRRMVRLLMKWMHAGVMEEGELHEVKEGTPQGGIISPLLANIYLHYVLDLWVQSWRKRHAHGEVYIVRYADDFVMGFQNEQDARAMRTALAERLATVRPGAAPGEDPGAAVRAIRPTERVNTTGLRKPETFDFPRLHAHRRHEPQRHLPTAAPYLAEEEAGEARPPQGGVPTATAPPVAEQHAWLRRVLMGTTDYYGVPTQHPRAGTLPAAKWPDLAPLAAAAEPASAVDETHSADRFREALPSSASPHPSSLAERNAFAAR